MAPAKANMIGMNTSSSTLSKAVINVAREATSQISIRSAEFDKFKKFNTTNVSKFVNPTFENFSKQYTNSEPEMLFVAEYVIDGKNLGVLVVWERLLDSTHYEVFKKNTFKSEAKYERVLFLDSKSLEEETSNFVDYLSNTLGFDVDPDKIFAILDTIVKEDRIYEYKVRAARVPRNATEVDYDFILQSKHLTKYVAVDSTNTNTLFDFSGITLGSKELAWAISVLNEGVPFFGRDALEKPLASFSLESSREGDRVVLTSNNLNDILSIINNSISLFGLRETYSHLLRVLGGLGSDFRDSFLDSIDETRSVFSYDSFRESIKKKVPVFNLVLQVAQSSNTNAVNALSKLSIVIPAKTGSDSFSSVESVTKILNFVNATFVSILYSQESADKIKVILEEIENGTLSAAVEGRTSGEAASVEISPETTTTSSVAQASAAVNTESTRSSSTDIVNRAATDLDSADLAASINAQQSPDSSTRASENGSSAALAPSPAGSSMTDASSQAASQTTTRAASRGASTTRSATRASEKELARDSATKGNKTTRFV